MTRALLTSLGALLALGCEPPATPDPSAPTPREVAPREVAPPDASAPAPAPDPRWSPAPGDARWSLSSPNLSLSGPGGARFGALVPRVRLAHAALGAGEPSARRARLSAAEVDLGAAVVTHTPTSWSARATARTARADLTYTLSGEPGSPALTASLTIAYREDTLVGAELADFAWRADSASAPDHAMRAVDLGEGALHVPSHTPREVDVALGEARLALLAPRVPALTASLAGRALTLTLELDHRDHHPFMTYDGCPAKKTNAPSRWLDSTPRRAGESVTHRWSVVLGDAPRPTPRRFPDGAASAISLTDHADQGRADRTEAFAFGAAGALARGDRPEAGFVGRGLRYTKTVFAHQKSRWPAQLSDPDFVRVARAMQDAGVGIGLHSVSGDTDSRGELTRDLAAFSEAFSGRVWIDHGPHHNCEALASRGWDPGDPHYSLDLLAGAGFDTVWAVKDLAVQGGRLDMLAPRRPGDRRAVLYTHERLRHRGGEGAPAPVVFASAWFFHGRARLLRRFSPANLDRLRDDHGLLLAHTYLDTYRATGKFAPRSLLASNGRLRDDVDAMFARLAVRQRANEVLTDDAGRLTHHLRDALRVELTPAPGGGWTAAHDPDATRPLRGLTLRASRAPFTLQAADPGALTRGASDAWLDLAPGAEALLFVTDPGGARQSPRPVHLTVEAAHADRPADPR